MKRILAVVLIVGLIYGISIAENMHQYETAFLNYVKPWLVEEYIAVWDSGFCIADTGTGVNRYVDTLIGAWRHLGSGIEEFAGMFRVTHACTSLQLDSADTFTAYVQSCIDPVDAPTVYTIHAFPTLTDTGTQFMYEPIESLIIGADIYGDWVRVMVIHSVQIDTHWCFNFDTLSYNSLGVDPSTFQMKWRKVK